VIRDTHHWRIVVNRNQNLLGKLVIALRRHEEQVARLSADEWGALRGEISWSTEHLRGAFAPDNFNYS
jgi:diadenosine tetraphosphate (Ap4A) HIT family hydrolase